MERTGMAIGGTAEEGGNGDGLVAFSPPPPAVGSRVASGGVITITGACGKVSLEIEAGVNFANLGIGVARKLRN